MIDNEELPIGFTMELAMHSDALVRFSNMNKEEQENIIDGAGYLFNKKEKKAIKCEKIINNGKL